jgi:capsular polysaccharide biosynthesis protein
MDETKEIEIDLRKVFYMMRTKIVFILLATVIFAVAAGCFTHFFIKPTYTANIKMLAYSNTDRVSTDASISNNEIDASQQLVNTDIYVLTSNTVLNQVAADLGLNVSAASLRNMITCTQVEDAFAFQVDVKTKDANLSAQIANSIAKIAPTEISNITKAGGVEVVDLAEVPSKPSSPNTKKNIIIGALAGFLLSFAGFFIYEMFDTTITNTKDLERDFNIPVLGTIPKLEEVEKTSNSDDGTSILKDIQKPSDSLLENIQAMKGDAKND